MTVPTMDRGLPAGYDDHAMAQQRRRRRRLRRLGHLCRHLRLVTTEAPAAAGGSDDAAGDDSAEAGTDDGDRLRLSQLVVDLQALGRLRSEGALSEEEFAAAKSRLLQPPSLPSATDAAIAVREALPKRVILLRHGESEGNADHTLYRQKPDNLIELTARGHEQARVAGRRIKALCGDGAILMYTSPFLRTVQTARAVRESIQPQVSLNRVEPRIREQEFGNKQDETFARLREDQMSVGRFWYRFPTGESGADVYDRVKQWWNDELM
jgi:bisphosphoglycerate-dependent phosphoglycerate mutase